MALPKLNTQRHELKIPSTGRSIEYRPYLVGEEKILLMAMESEDEGDMIRALRDTIKACTFDEVDVSDLATFDLEYIFLKLRSKSTGENATVVSVCKNCGNENEVHIDLNQIQVQGEIKKKMVVALTDDIGVVLKYPSVGRLLDSVNNGENEKSVYDTVISTIDSIYDDDNVYPIKDEAREEVVEFLDSLTREQFQKIVAELEDMPQLKHEQNIECSKCHQKQHLVLEGLQSFF